MKKYLAFSILLVIISNLLFFGIGGLDLEKTFDCFADQVIIASIEVFRSRTVVCYTALTIIGITFYAPLISLMSFVFWKHRRIFIPALVMMSFVVCFLWLMDQINLIPWTGILVKISSEIIVIMTIFFFQDGIEGSSSE